MTRDELIAAVPVHYQDGRPYFVDLEEIPAPWREQFWGALYGSQCPIVQGVRRAAYAWDWSSWVTDSWYAGRNGPTGLADGRTADPAVMHAFHRLADYPVLALLTRGRTEATRLDGRTCRYFYETAAPGINCRTISPAEQAFIRSLGLDVDGGP